MAKHASNRPSQAAPGGGGFGFPSGSQVTITEICWTTWEDAGEKAITKGREADDPCLKIVGEVEGIDEERSVHLGAGKAARNSPSRDGNFLDGEGIPEGSNAHVFLRSVHDVKAHKKNAVPEEVTDDGIDGLTGLVFIAGMEAVKREGLEGTQRPTLVASEIVEQPKAKKGGKKKKDEDDDEEDEKPARRSSKAKDEDDEDEEDEKPSRPKGGNSSKDDEEDDEDEDDGDAEKDAEKAVISALDSPKYRKGIPTDKLYVAVLAKVRDAKNREDIMGLVEDEKWVAARKRPWNVEDDTVVAV